MDRHTRPGCALLTIVVAILFGLLAALASTSSLAQSGQKSAAWTATDCATFKLENIPAGSGVECGYVAAPLRHARPDGVKIQLGTVIIPSHDPHRQPDPLFLAQGGPGGSTIGTFASIIINSPEYNPAPNRDLVLWDQRGTLYSKPALTCPEATQAHLQAALVNGQSTDSGDELEPYRACGARLAKEAGDLSAFNSAENADDAEDVRVTLGYEQFNYWGVSYGTELGQFILRRQPAHLRGIILDAVVPLSYNLFTEPAFAKQRIAEKYFGACAAAPRCNAAFPNLAQRYLALYDRLNANPATLTVAPLELKGNLLNAKTYQVKLSGSGLEGALYQALYGPVHDLIPLIVDRADKGDFTYVADFLLPAGLFDDSMAEGMYFAVACAERADTNPDVADYSRINPRLAEQERASAKAEIALCKNWGIELLPHDQLALVRSEKPVLLLSGDFDPITPPVYAEQLLEGLPNAQHIIFPLGSHGQGVSSPCGNRIITSFLDNPTAKVDGSCARAAVPHFLTEADVITIPAIRQALASGGLFSLSTLGVLLRIAPGLLGALFILTGVLVFPISWIAGRLRHSAPGGANSGWTVGWVRWAPWIALAAGLTLLLFFVGLGAALGTTLAGNQNLFLIGAISSRWRWLFFLPLLGAMLVALLVVCTVALWSGRHHSHAGRVYYTLLAVAGIIGILSFAGLGVLGLAFG